MKRSTKYVGLDVHQATAVTTVREEGGQVIARSIVPTQAVPIIELFRGMRGTINVAFEEGTQAQWLHDLLVPVVDRVIVCDRRGQASQGNKAERQAGPRGVSDRTMVRPARPKALASSNGMWSESEENDAEEDCTANREAPESSGRGSGCWADCRGQIAKAISEDEVCPRQSLS